ncbi:MAG TPA: hypothetical protein VLA62_03225 [Solirubrobacterales bacterium]|nr:hypothetical protein [Solirubrobacterales bacterium]
MSQHEDPRVAELESRIRAIEALDDASLGRFGAWDWIAAVLCGLVLPAAALWWFAG